jgi:hypothetical protein
LWSDLKVTKWIGREKNHHHIFLVLYLPYRREVAYTTTTCWSRTFERTLWIHPHANQTLVEHATMRWMWQLTLEAWLSCVNTNFLHSNNVLPLFRISNLSWIVILLYYWFLLCFIMWFGLDNIHWMNIYAEYFNLPCDEILYIGGGVLAYSFSCVSIVWNNMLRLCLWHCLTTSSTYWWIASFH